MKEKMRDEEEGRKKSEGGSRWRFWRSRCEDRGTRVKETFAQRKSNEKISFT